MKLRAIALLALSTAAACYAQSPAPPKPAAAIHAVAIPAAAPAPAPAAVPFVPCSPTPDASGLTGCEKLLLQTNAEHMQADQARMQAIQSDMAMTDSQMSQAIAGIEGGHSGFRYVAPTARDSGPMAAGHLQPVVPASPVASPVIDRKAAVAPAAK